MTLLELRYAPDNDLDYGDAYWIKEWSMKSPKYVFLHKGAVFLRRVLKALGLKSKVCKHPGGIAVHGEVTGTVSLEPSKVLYLCLGPSPHEPDNCALLWRVGERPYATDGTNHWITEDITAKEVAVQIAPYLPHSNVI